MTDILNIEDEPIIDDRIVKIKTHTYNPFVNTTFGYSDEIKTHTTARLIRRHGSVSGVKYIAIERYTATETLPCIFTRVGEMRAREIFESQ